MANENAGKPEVKPSLEEAVNAVLLANPNHDFGETNGAILVKGNIVAVLFRTDKVVHTTDKGTPMYYGIPRGFIPRRADGTALCGMQVSAWRVKDRKPGGDRPPVKVIL